MRGRVVRRAFLGGEGPAGVGMVGRFWGGAAGKIVGEGGAGFDGVVLDGSEAAADEEGGWVAGGETR